ncbi:uncharacterized protein V1510DRAFT_434894 [Dipodascopsis tothii]|uniref:uncharacterized protein n=1 Tax=Dipodascopsis tothii TaxID=44089 RepID=UPI0034CDAE31
MIGEHKGRARLGRHSGRDAAAPRWSAGPAGEPGPGAPLLALPPEILLLVFALVGGDALAEVAGTCRQLRKFVTDTDELWRTACAALRAPTPAPYGSWQALFRALRPHMWLRPGAWHGDKSMFGSFLIARYARDTGRLEAYELLCLRNLNEPPEVRNWTHDPFVVVQDFRPRIALAQFPTVVLAPDSAYDERHQLAQPPSPQRVAMRLMHAAPLAPGRLPAWTPVWPPRTVPARERARAGSVTGFAGAPVPPRAAAADVFRVRMRLLLTGRLIGITAGMMLETVARVDDAAWRPTAQCPLRGIWVGDYESHGGEFVVFLQPDASRLEAVKLTGDPNVPRGELTFVVDDLAHTVRTCTEPEWPGARVYAARGHTASLNFTNGKADAGRADPDTFSPTQLIVVDHNTVAHYWTDLYRIKTYRRVDIDAFLAGPVAGSGLVGE